MSNLRRTAIGRFEVADAVPLDSVNSASLHDLLLKPEAAVAELPQRKLDPEEVVRIRQGRPIPWGFIPDADCHGEVTLVDSAGKLIGIAQADPNQQIGRAHV